MGQHEVTLTGGPLDGQAYTPDRDDVEDPWVAILVDGAGDNRAVYAPDDRGVWRHTGWTRL